MPVGLLEMAGGTTSRRPKTDRRASSGHPDRRCGHDGIHAVSVRGDPAVAWDGADSCRGAAAAVSLVRGWGFLGNPRTRTLLATFQRAEPDFRVRGPHAALQRRFFRTLLKRGSNRPIRRSAVTRELQKSSPGWRDSLVGRVDSLWGFRRMPRLGIAKGNDECGRSRPAVTSL